jgi:hypothetical protein
MKLPSTCWTKDKAEQSSGQTPKQDQAEQRSPSRTTLQNPGAAFTTTIRQSLTTPRAVVRSVICPIITSYIQSLTPSISQGTDPPGQSEQCVSDSQETPLDDRAEPPPSTCWTKDKAEQSSSQTPKQDQAEQRNPSRTTLQHLGAALTTTIRQSLTTPRAVVRSVNRPIITLYSQSLTPPIPQGTDSLDQAEQCVSDSQKTSLDDRVVVNFSLLDIT